MKRKLLWQKKQLYKDSLIALESIYAKVAAG